MVEAPVILHINDTATEIARAVANLVHTEDKPTFMSATVRNRRTGKTAETCSVYFGLKPELQEPALRIAPFRKGGYQVFINPSIHTADITEMNVMRKLEKLPKSLS